MDAGVRSRVVPPNQVDLLGESGFKVIQVFRIDLLCLRDKLVHLRSHLSFNLQLLHVRDVVCQRVLPKEVPDEDLFDVGLLAKAGASLREGTTLNGAVSVCIWLT